MPFARWLSVHRYEGIPTMPSFRQLLIGAILLAMAIAVAAGISLRQGAQPLTQADANAESAQILLVDMGVSTETTPT